LSVETGGITDKQCIEAKLVVFQNTYSPTESIVAGIVTDTNELQPQNALSAIAVTL